ncbi:MAG: branched-chain amino acid ABC transporter permease, partial [Paracoccaceae bacterium]|nr:branched-chain amino acid ABC transporter permease [Paracoccaceae bacterium]
VIAGMIASVAGLLTAQQNEFVSPALATWQHSGDLLVILVVGGLGSRNGALLGALFIVAAQEALGAVLPEWRLIYGPLLVGVVLFAKGGLNSLLAPGTAGPGR